MHCEQARRAKDRKPGGSSVAEGCWREEGKSPGDRRRSTQTPASSQEEDSQQRQMAQSGTQESPGDVDTDWLTATLHYLEGEGRDSAPQNILESAIRSIDNPEEAEEDMGFRSSARPDYLDNYDFAAILADEQGPYDSPRGRRRWDGASPLTRSPSPSESVQRRESSLSVRKDRNEGKNRISLETRNVKGSINVVAPVQRNTSHSRGTDSSNVNEGRTSTLQLSNSTRGSAAEGQRNSSSGGGQSRTRDSAVTRERHLRASQSPESTGPRYNREPRDRRSRTLREENSDVGDSTSLNERSGTLALPGPSGPQQNASPLPNRAIGLEAPHREVEENNTGHPGEQYGKSLRSVV